MSRADDFAVADQAVQNFALSGELTDAELAAGAATGNKWMSLVKSIALITKSLATSVLMRAGTDNTTLITPKLLKGHGVEYSLISGISATTALTVDYVGGLFALVNTAAMTLTMPATSGVPNGATISLVATTALAVTLAVASGDVLTNQTGTSTAYILGAGDTAHFTRINTEWRLTGGTIAPLYSADARNRTRGLADCGYNNQTPAANSAFSISRPLTAFVAPCNGFVMATQALNCGAVAATSMSNIIRITGSVSGSVSQGDLTPNSQCSNATLKVAKGETVSVTGTVAGTVTTTTWPPVGIQTAYIFVPTNN